MLVAIIIIALKYTTLDYALHDMFFFFFKVIHMFLFALFLSWSFNKEE